ncbi:protein EPIDERMAL PATTERNING FACTOR 1 isoform X2 [Cicer arietinum]|uniref:Epidermal patterning factor-like protein n=1 Tax=Cicer arietinum TaxID=3827 RepID=A0A1S2XF22_CICAR|nr:protein EPIDERMAL PATTERNING FACTOR 1 isoform X2 [Cicer arietinum]
MMKRSFVYAAVFVLLSLYFPMMITSSRHIRHSNSREGHLDVEMGSKGTRERLHWEGRSKHHMRRPDTMQVAGSRLPDCSHACGSCTPCRLVMVSLVCASLAEAESCPMAYKCMCHNKSYPVP